LVRLIARLRDGTSETVNVKKQNKNGTYQIEKGVPMPVIERRFPIIEMEPGDSFALPADKTEVRRARNAIYRFGKGKQFTIRRWRNGYRCWRIK